ncbi:retrovirus-related pol polyprotein from transposon TNT 1-94 [Tanacetum coccineum]
MVEEVTSLKMDFKQKENKYLEEFFDMKALKEKVGDKLYKQDQSLQIVHMLCKPKPYYNKQNKVAIGYKNPLCLTRAKQVQPAIYNGYEIIKNNHVPALVHNTEDTLEIAEITRRKMNDKMKDPEWLTEGEKGFEQTKECYLTKVIPFFKTLKGHFEGIQKALTKEIKEMKDIFEELEAKVDQNVVNRKHDEIERKNLLIANDNLIADCLSKEVFYITTNSELTVSRFIKMHEAHIFVQSRCLELEAELSKLRDKVQRDDHTELLKCFSNLENTQKTNVPVPPSTGVNCCTNASGSYPRSNTKKNRISPAKGINKKKVEEHPWTNKSNLRTKNRVDSSSSSKRIATAPIYNIHNVVRKVKQVWKPKQVRQVWKPTGKVLTSVGHQWRPTGRIFTLGEQCPLTRLTKPKVVQIVLWYLDSGCSKHMTGDRSRLKNFVKKFIGTVRFGNDHFGAIMGYGDYVIGDSVISRVYYVEGLGHNLFSVGQFCDSDLEVAFRKHSCYVRDTDGVELIKGSRGSNLYTISVEDMMKSSPICLLSKASKNKSWLWHRRLNHLNFGTINDLARKDLVRGLPRLKFEKDHLCSACQLGKSKKHTHKPKTENTNLEVLNTLHMDLCRPMRVQTINGKKYILVIVDDYSRFTWVKFLRSKDETPEVVIKFLKQIQVGLNKTIRYICTDNGT